MGMGLLLCLYNMEWFARQNCPENHVSTAGGEIKMHKIFFFFSQKYVSRKQVIEDVFNFS